MKASSGKIIAVLIIGILTVSIAFTYLVSVNQYAYAKNELIDKSRAIAQLILAERAFLAANQDIINRDAHANIEFKGLNPARGVFLTAQYFNQNRSYQIKQTSFVDMVRNIQNMPDEWELTTLTEFKRSPQSKELYGETHTDEGNYFRYALPLFIDQTCLGCHGEQTGEIDITGHQKEGYKLGELRGILSISVPVESFNTSVRSLVSKLLAGGTALGIFVALSVGLILYFGLLKPAQRQLLEASQLAAAGRLAADVAHEINNPLGIISSRAELMLQEADLPAQAAQDTEVIRRNAARIADYTKGLLSFARPFSSSPQKVDLNQIVGEIILFVEKQLNKKDIVLESQLCASPPKVWAQKGQLQQIMLNLLGNAADALPEGGKILITTGQFNIHEVYVAVQDNGTGIRTEDIGKIFDPFYSTKGNKGNGLGLAVSLNLAKENGGRIIVENLEEQGALFKLILPGSLEKML